MGNKKIRNMSGSLANEAYETRVALNALERAGQCPNLHGHVHELMFCDKYNANPLHFLNGEQANLTKSATATMKDVIMTKGGKVVGHAQLKDTSSLSGLCKTARQINSGKYGKTAVFGTEETAAGLLGKTRQPVHSSGISSQTTSRIAGKALGQMPTLGALGTAVRSGGAAGAAIGAGIEAVSSGIDWLNGDKEFGDMVIDVGGAAAKGGITGAGSATAGSLAAGATGAVLASTGVGAAIGGTALGAAAVACAPVAVGFAAAYAVGSFISDLFD